MSGPWRVQKGDDLRWARPEFDDSGWQEALLPSTWEVLGLTGHDGPVWFRRQVELDEHSTQLAVGEKLAVSRIVSLLAEEPLSTAEISETLGLNPSDVGKKMNRSSRQGLVRFDVDSKRYTLAVSGA